MRGSRFARGVEVVAVAPAEWERLRALRLRALAADPAAFGATLAEESARATDAWRAWAFAQTPLVARREGAWVGLCFLKRREADEAEVMGLWVAPEARGEGAARALLEDAIRRAREGGATRLVLWVNVAQAPAMRLYRAVGFTPLAPPQPGTRDPSRMFQQLGLAL